MKHKRTPEIFAGTDAGQPHIYTTDGAYMTALPMTLENKQRIARTWNTHDELVAALEDALEYIEAKHTIDPSFTMREIIAKARGEA